MNRRSLLVAAGAVGLSAAVGGAAAAVAADDPERHRPQPMLTWELTGGFVPAGWNTLRAPRLVAYDDGVLIADATRRLKIGPGELRSLRNHATGVLRDPANSRRRPDAPIIADAPWTVLTARANGRRFSARFEGLEETRSDRVFPAPTYALLDHLTQLRNRVLASGSPWRPDAVRLVAVLLEPLQPTGPRPPATVGMQPPPWPFGVPVPQFGKDDYVARLDLRGREARALVRAVPHPDQARWTVLRLPDGRRVQINWRFLLPSE